MVTWGKILEIGCEGCLMTRQTVAMVTYLVTVSPGCTLIGEDLTFTGLIECICHVSVKAMRLLAPSILNIMDIIPQEQVMTLLQKMHFDQLCPVAQVDLAPLPIPTPAFNWVDMAANDRLDWHLL